MKWIARTWGTGKQAVGQVSRQPLEQEIPAIAGPDARELGADPGSAPNFLCDLLSTLGLWVYICKKKGGTYQWPLSLFWHEDPIFKSKTFHGLQPDN